MQPADSHPGASGGGDRPSHALAITVGSSRDLRRLRTRLRAWLAQAGVEDGEAEASIVAANEAVTACMVQGADAIAVTATLDGETLVVRLTLRWGAGPLPEAAEAGGFGLIHRLAADVRTGEDAYTPVVMTFRVGAAALS